MTRIAAFILFMLFALPVGAQASGPVAVTFLPLWSMAQSIMGSSGEPVLLVPPGTEVHEFSMRPSDLKTIQNAKAIIINGAGLDDHIVAKLPMAVISATAGIGLMEHDPHVWLDPVLAKAQVRAIAAGLAAQMPMHKALYEQNANRLAEDIDALHQQAQAALAPFAGQTLVTYHQAFGYFARRYGLKHLSLTGPGGEQPLPERIKAAYDLVRKENIKAIFSERQFPASALERMKKDLGVTVCTLDTLESGDKSDDFYLKAMAANIATLERCLKGTK